MIAAISARCKFIAGPLAERRIVLDDEVALVADEPLAHQNPVAEEAAFLPRLGRPSDSVALDVSLVDRR
jgi:hypothetical protein